jgi:hypothetical protein
MVPVCSSITELGALIEDAGTNAFNRNRNRGPEDNGDVVFAEAKIDEIRLEADGVLNVQSWMQDRGGD